MLRSCNVVHLRLTRHSLLSPAMLQLCAATLRPAPLLGLAWEPSPAARAMRRKAPAFASQPAWPARSQPLQPSCVSLPACLPGRCWCRDGSGGGWRLEANPWSQACGGGGLPCSPRQRATAAPRRAPIHHSGIPPLPSCCSLRLPSVCYWASINRPSWLPQTQTFSARSLLEPK